MKEKNLVFENGICEMVLLNLHRITVIVCFGSVCTEAESSLCICFPTSAFSYGNWEETDSKRFMVVLIKCTFDLAALIVC